MMAPMPYYCIHCGNEEKQVYKTYASGNLVKLLNCRKCGQLVDPYVEYDTLIVAMNLLLQNAKAYRHILLNTAFLGYWKLGIIFLFSEAYCTWCYQQGKKTETGVIDFYELEINFYRVLLRTILGTAAFHGAMLLSVVFQSKIFSTKLPSQFSYLTLWKGLCLCGFAQIMELLALIWSYSHTRSSFLFVNCLLVLSNAKSYEVVTGVHKYSALIITLWGLCVQKCAGLWFDQITNWDSNIR